MTKWQSWEKSSFKIAYFYFYIYWIWARLRDWLSCIVGSSENLHQNIRTCVGKNDKIADMEKCKVLKLSAGIKLKIMLYQSKLHCVHYKTTNTMFPGSELLNKYQIIWEELHKTSMSQAETAASAAQSIFLLHEWVKRQDGLITQLTSGVGELPSLARTIDQCTGRKLFIS